jgi:tetratricopeptide (TPR) repeat protein
MSKYNTDLDYVILRSDYSIGISWEELKEIETEAEKIILENKESKENLAIAHLKKAQIMRRHANGQTYGFIFYYETGWQFLSPKEKKDIKKHLEKAMELIPNMPEALMQLGLFYNSGWGNKNNKAINLISKAIQLKPDYAAALNNRAMLFYRSGFNDDENDNEQHMKIKTHYKNAVADLTEAIKIRPSDAIYYLNRGVFHSRLKEHNEAVEDFSKAMNYASDVLKEKLKTEVKIFNLRGKEYTELAEYGKAINDFTESLRLIKEDNDESHKRYEENMELVDLDRAYRDFYETIFLRGKAYYLAGEKDKAKADIDEYLNRKYEATATNNRREIIRIVGVTPEEILNVKKRRLKT